MCQICGVNVEFFNGVPTGRAPLGTIAFDSASNYTMYVFNGGWQAIGSNFIGSFQSTGGVTNTDFQAVGFFNGPPTGRAPQGQIGFDTSTNPYTIYVFSAGWQEIGVSSAPAADLLAVCGPNVLFSATNPPPAPPFCLPQGTIVIPVVSGPHAAYVSNNCTLEPFDLGGSPPVTTQLFITDNSFTTFNVPIDFNPLNNKIEIVGRGGTGGVTSSLGGGGGGGGGYAYANNVNLTPGTTVNIHFGFTDGETVWMENNLSTIICQASNGRFAGHTAGGAGGVKIVGDGGNPGGAGGSAVSAGGGGGGGAGGPLGPGANGGNSLSDSGGGGGGANNGIAGNVASATGTGANGGKGGVLGSSGGAGATYPPALNDGGAGTLGGGGGGAGGYFSFGGAFGDGGTANGDQYYGAGNKGFCGGGGGGPGNTDLTMTVPFAQTGGSGFNRGYGGGGGGSGGDAGGGAGINGGCDGMIVVTYTT